VGAVWEVEVFDEILEAIIITSGSGDGDAAGAGGSGAALGFVERGGLEVESGPDRVVIGEVLGNGGVGSALGDEGKGGDVVEAITAASGGAEDGGDVGLEDIEVAEQEGL